MGRRARPSRASRDRGGDIGSEVGPPTVNSRAVDLALREYARHRSALDAAEAFDLVRAEQLKIYVSFGFVSLYEYMEHVLGYKPHTARERMRVARALAALPETTAALARGALSYSAVRELTRVATAETEADWLAQTEGLVADERGSEIGDADFIEAICRSMIGPGTGERGPAHQIAYQQCQDCRRATQNGAGREIDVGPEVLERAAWARFCRTQAVIEQRVQEIFQASDTALQYEPSLTSERTGRHTMSQLGRRARWRRR